MLSAFDKKIGHCVEFNPHGPLAQLVEQLTLNQRVARFEPSTAHFRFNHLAAVNRPPLLICDNLVTIFFRRPLKASTACRLRSSVA